MLNQFSRTELLIGKDSIEKLKNSRVAVFGIGGVGGHVVEALIRSGLGKIDIIDNDKVCVAEERILDINPDVQVKKYQTFYTPETANEFDFSNYDYVVDAIDTVVGKISLVEKCKEYNVPIICAMGAGNKMDPTKFEVADISKTSVCPLAKVIRQELRKRKIKKVKVVYSKEIPIKPNISTENTIKHQIPGSNAFVPSVVGLIIAGEVIKDLIGYNTKS